MTIITLEGNIGSGKEIFMNFFKKYYSDEIIFLEDSIYSWEEKDLLKSFYKDPKRWAFTLEINSTLRKYKLLDDINSWYDKKQFIMTKRSPMSDISIFSKSLESMKYINPKEMTIYKNAINSVNTKKNVYNGVIYLKSNVNRCYEHIVSNKSGPEKEIDFDYLNLIHTNYISWISNLKKEGCNILEIDFEEYRDLEGNEMLEEKLSGILNTKFPELIYKLKTRNIYK